MANVDNLLSALDKTRRTGDNRWIACCPAHTDKSPSLSIGYKDDKIILHCFGGCSVDEVVGSLGMTLADLMPENPTYSRPVKSRIPASDLLQFIASEATIIWIAAGDIVAGKQLSEADLARVQTSRQRLFDAVQECVR